ncbi:MAG: ferrous iron transport protein B [Kosmotogaceae bacterium]
MKEKNREKTFRSENQMKKDLGTIALLGNPNVGKTSVFNLLTGMKQYVANWPGVTVEKRVGKLERENKSFKVVDLPGTYTLGASSLDEKITRDYLIEEDPEIVVVIADAVNLERSLYLLFQVLEMRGDVVLAINSIDEAKKENIYIDPKELRQHLGIPVHLISAYTGEGVEGFAEGIFKYDIGSTHVHHMFSKEIENRITELSSIFRNRDELKEYDSRWLSIKVLEGDEDICKLTGINLKSSFSSEISQLRYEHIKYVLKESYKKPGKEKWGMNTATDHVFTHKYLGLAIFFSFMYLVFEITFTFGEPFALMIEEGLGVLGSFINSLIGIEWLAKMLSEGIVGGVGAVLVFVPNIFILFLVMGILEESGYLPRAAFVVDKAMYALKLSGRSFMSLLLGFGCNVTSIMSTRSISEPQERIVTAIVSPFISCSARLPVYIMIAGVFFGARAGIVIFSIYLFSIFITAISSIFINKLLFKGKPAPMIMELPRYRTPKISSLIQYTWNRGKHFLKKAGSIILVSSIVIWFLSYYPVPGKITESFAAKIGHFLEPLFVPIGFTWEMVTSLIFGVAAKEVIVSTLSTLTLSAQANSSAAVELMKSGLTQFGALAFLMFVLLYVPCLPTLIVLKNETGKWRYLVLSIVYSFSIAYVVALIISLIGRLLM